MLTCKVGDSMVNTMDYSNEQIRKWSKKNILKCPVCDGEMIYKNGLIKIEHFAHKKDECTLEYHENETKEHLEGKVILYDFIKTQDGCENVQLESWIPETKQRPDIYFEKDGKRFVIEFQCTPIASEYLERHELYKLAGIEDIWIMGTDKYNIGYESDIITHSKYYKVLEKHSVLYLNVNNSEIYFNECLIKERLPNNIISPPYFRCKINDFTISGEIFYLKEDVLNYLIEKGVAKWNERNQIIIKLNNMYKNENIIFDFSYDHDNNGYYNWRLNYNYGNKGYYNWRIDLVTRYVVYIFYINKSRISFYSYSKIYNKSHIIKDIDSFLKIKYIDDNKYTVEELNDNNDIIPFISSKLDKIFEKKLKTYKETIEAEKIYKEQRKEEETQDKKEEERALNRKISIIDGNYNVDTECSCNIHKFFDNNSKDPQYLYWVLIEQILDDKKDVFYILHNKTTCGQSISNNNRLNIIKKFNNLGFTDVSFL